MILNDLKLPVGYTDEMLEKAIFRAAKKRFKIHSVRILRRSIDARKKPQLFYVMKVAVNEKEGPGFTVPKLEYGRGPVKIAVIGSGPAGLFAAKALSEAGACVTVFERGKPVEERTRDVQDFFSGKPLDPECNIQFGEGGAGTFSDGKLNTRVKDTDGLNAYVLKTFSDACGDETILYDANAHIGTDLLPDTVRSIREGLKEHGVTFRFSTKMTGLLVENQRVTGIRYQQTDETDAPEETEAFSAVILAIGHSARDTFRMLKDTGIPMEKKPFAIGVRMEHPQEMITLSQYGSLDYEELGPAPYHLSARANNGRGVYSFCMCPGGQVVNASSEEGRLVINGMSDHKRSGRNANAGR